MGKNAHWQIDLTVSPGQSSLVSDHFTEAFPSKFKFDWKFISLWFCSRQWYSYKLLCKQPECSFSVMSTNLQGSLYKNLDESKIKFPTNLGKREKLLVWWEPGCQSSMQVVWKECIVTRWPGISSDFPSSDGVRACNWMHGSYRNPRMKFNDISMTLPWPFLGPFQVSSNGKIKC